MNILFDLLKKEKEKYYLYIINGYNTSKYLTFRVNNILSNNNYVLDYLNNNNIIYEYININNIDIYFLDNSYYKTIISSSLYKDGLLYLQNFSSMLPILLLNNSYLNVIDFCSSPGGKASLYYSLYPTSLLTCVEKNKIRFERLKYNLEKLGLKKVNLINKDVLSLDNLLKYDLVMLDAPCSGSGTISYENIKFDFSKINQICNLQDKLFKKALKLTKLGGYILYSTCSILDCENINIINNYLNFIQIEKLKFPKFDNIKIIEYNNMYTILPNKYCEGFFICLVKKIREY